MKKTKEERKERNIDWMKVEKKKKQRREEGSFT